MRYLLFLFTILLISGCGTKRKTTEGSSDAVSLSEAEEVLRSLEANHFDATWLDARASMRLESPQMNVGGTAYIRLQKDEKLWVSIKKFGFEAARMLVTPDSFYVINRLTNEYSADPISYVTERFGVPANFELLQELVLGNPIFFDRNLALVDHDGAYKLHGQTNRWVSDYYVDRSSFLLNSMRLKQRSPEQEVSVFMDNYQPTTTGIQFANTRSVEVNSPSVGMAKIEMDFTKVTFNEEVGMPFQVPQKFRN